MTSYQVSILSAATNYENVIETGTTLPRAITRARREAEALAGQPFVVDVYEQSDERGNVLVRTYEAWKTGVTR